eukprot:1275689-Rhodomonas_salina.1
MTSKFECCRMSIAISLITLPKLKRVRQIEFAPCCSGLKLVPHPFRELCCKFGVSLYEISLKFGVSLHEISLKFGFSVYAILLKFRASTAKERFGSRSLVFIVSASPAYVLVMSIDVAVKVQPEQVAGSVREAICITSRLSEIPGYCGCAA